MAISGPGMANMGFYGVLPMGYSNYGGDVQIWNVPQYASTNINIGFNPMAQASLGSVFGGGGMFGMGAFQQLGLPDVETMAKAIVSPIIGKLAMQNMNTNTQGASTLETRLQALLETEGITDDDKEEINALLNEVKEHQKEMKALEESDLSNDEIYEKTREITDKLTKISQKASKISSRIEGYDTKAAEAQGLNEEDSADEEDSPRRGTVKSGLNSSAYGPEFLEKVKEIAKRINCDYKDLLGLMNSESGINAKAKNPHGSATGLIQFIESTAKSLGTSTAALRKMSPIKQLDYVEKCIQNSKSAAGFSSSHRLSAGELYSLIFLPARANREVLTTKGENYYAANYQLDKNKDGKITRAELGARIRNFSVSDSSFYA